MRSYSYETVLQINVEMLTLGPCIYALYNNCIHKKELFSERYVMSTLCFTAEALHLAHLLSAHGYLFPIDDHILTVKNDNTYYRFQVSNKID